MTFFESRPSVQVLFMMRFLATAATRGHPLSLRGLGGALVWLCATVFVYAFNGITDMVEDRANCSSRPIASGQLAPRQALVVAGAAAATAVLGGLALGTDAVVLVLIELALGYAYSGPPIRGKRHVVGATATGALGGFVTYLAGSAITDRTINVEVMVFAVAASVWMGVVGTAAKDLSDIAGDAVAGRRTVGVVLGEATGRRVAAVTALVVGWLFLVVCVTREPDLLLPGMVLAAGGVAVAVTALAGRCGGSRDERRRPYRVFMVTQYALNLALVGRLLV
jgi:4-hydroxybenzoate polyprenyltransferase